MLTKIKILTLFIIFFTFLPFFFVSAGTVDLGQVCTQDADCVSTKCGQSTLTGAQTKFCVCANETQCETKFKKDTGETWTCKPGETKTKGLAYCLSSTKGIQDPVPSAGTTATPEATAAASATPIKLTKPTLSIPIPSMPSFAEIEVAPGQKASIPYIAQYITGIYKYGLTLGSILAVMMIVAGGIMYLISSADPSKIATAKQMIFGSITGLTVLLCSYLLLNIINPNLVNPEAIGVETVEAVSDFDFLEATSKVGEDYVSPGTPYVPSGIPITTSGVPIKLDGNQTREMASALGKKHDVPFCDVKTASTKAEYPGISIDYKYLGSLDCNTSSGKRKKIEKIVLHNGFGYTGDSPKYKISTCITMWRTNEIGYNIVCEKKLVPTKKGQKEKWNDGACEKQKATVGQKVFLQSPASTHYYIEYDGHIFQTMGENLIATHCGGTKGHTSCNGDSIGIDLAYKDESAGGKWKFSYTEAQYQSLGKLLKAIAQRHGLSITDSVVVAHSDCQDNRVDPYNLIWEKVASFSGGTLTSAAHPKSQGGKSGYLCN